ncbi:AER376Wp [Eremothecium gossypii ATCC 10895]|uniref:Regulator of rDNA transcription 14 n=1 Tax=Eremothecium gossypii (strain ATCC 10895 / CBS 109.51 / FGSC 9923 / NRRL Y-1056) TaxID=284811 RepID=RRT14_EREGS|nr:AER376Wp [Eremothecium gossypii ATCC 10895]Q755Z1.2 RecName: Full=Regulator of rDNA transcription 14 [Eremothecium gossypii ATCC 10895]AAS53056.2 AER376Wp [Eremothecium gossypii ATCC 10895]AEY97364.1 FAER376Wp [Eremothecium gossypii FDAG1]
MKQRVAVRERDRLQEKERLRRQRQRAEREARQQASQAEQEAKLAALERHQETGRLTKEEKRYLNKRTRQGAARARTWDLDEDEADEAAALQSQILDRIGSASGAGRVRKQRRARIREALPKASEDRRYAGLTPGLAPVGMSDEESSDEELSDEED